jgi:DNA polymerase I
MNDGRKRLCLIDGSAYIFRAYHAIRGLTNSEGMATNALFGYVNMLGKVIADLAPDYVAVIMDSKGPTFRKDMYSEYKANRPPPPEDLKEQFPFVEPLTEALGFPTVRAEGFEADDIIATMAARAGAQKVAVTIVSSDKDLMQLVNDDVVMFDPMKNRWFRREEVVEKHGVPPERMVDLLSIMGDSSDNVPGVRGIGAKGAAKLITEYGGLDDILANVENVHPPRAQKALLEFGDNALMSRELVKLRMDAPSPEDLHSLAPRDRDLEKLRELYAFLGFRRMLQAVTPSSQSASQDAHHPASVTSTPRMPEPQVVTTAGQLQELARRIAAKGEVSLDTETTSVRPVKARLVGISAATEPGKVFYIPLAHTGEGAGNQLQMEQVRDVLSPLLGDPRIKTIGQNFKYDTVVLKNHGFAVEGLGFDTMLASYLLNPGRASHSLDNLGVEFLGVKLISYKEVTTRGGIQLRFDRVPVADAARYAGEDAWATLLLKEKLAPEVDQQGLRSLLEDVELPVSEVLAEMELRGVSVDTARLESMSLEFEGRMGELESQIHHLAGTPFNVNSPKQLGEVLFERLGLPRKRKTKTGYSTDSKVLDELAHAHPLPAKILEFRTLAKLKSTYVDVLPTLVNETTGRIHTSFNQAITATGRLSSSDPNLQNIPIRGAEGKKIREAFIPGPGMKYLAADYSQVELRVLAHLSKDKALIRAFNSGEDIHSRTAAEIFHVLPGLVTPDMRRVAKTINFGIVYGMSAFRLSRDQKIPMKQAKGFIDAYFARYPGIRQFLDSVVEEGKERGYVETILKRRRYMPELQARNRQVFESGRRMAINTPVQGGAADIVKLAMLQLHRRLKKEGLDAYMVLQVHDELVLELAPSATEGVKAAVKETMENVLKLDVPLKVDVGVGDNWAQVHG